jgi:hypothetical protein
MFSDVLTCFAVILSESTLDCTKAVGGDNLYDSKAFIGRT